MIDFLIGSVWGWLSVTAIIVIAALAVAWFIPPLRGYALMAAGAALAVGGFAARVAAAAKRQKQKEWDNAIERDIKKGQQARADAERAVDADPDGVQHDKWNRDKS